LHVKLVGSDDAKLVPRPQIPGNNDFNWELAWEAWFPDGQRFLVNAHPASESRGAWSPLTSSIWSVAVSGGPPRKLRDRAYAWSTSPDGLSIAFNAGDGEPSDRTMWLMGPNGEHARPLYEASYHAPMCCLHFFPGKERVSYITEDDTGDILVARDLKGGPVTTLLSAAETKGMLNGEFSWLPDGRIVSAQSCAFARFDTPCNLWLLRPDIRAGRMIDKPRRLTNITGASLFDPSTTSDGKRIAFRQSSGHGTAYVADLSADGTSVHNVRHFTLDEGDDAIYDWTPDGKAAIVTRNRGTSYAVYKQLISADRLETIVARADGGLVEDASLTPDGQWLVLALYPSPVVFGPVQPFQIVRVSMTGGSVEYLFRASPGSGIACAKAPSSVCVIGEPSADGRQIVVSSLDPATSQRTQELLRYERLPPADDEFGPVAFALSPDGAYLASSAGMGGPLRILSLHGGGSRAIPAQGLKHLGRARWMADGKSLVVSDASNDGPALWRIDGDGRTQMLWKCESQEICFAVPSPDRHHLAIYQGNVVANMWILENF
jgi:hypothetical protein